MAARLTMTTDPRLPILVAAIAKLEPGGWSLTVGGFACRALKIKKPTPAETRELRDLMNQTGLPARRVKYGSDMIDVWDVQK